MVQVEKLVIPVVQVEKLFILPNFVVLKIEENGEIPLILGRPFLATIEANMSMAKGNVTLTVDGKEVRFNIHDLSKALTFSNDKTCLRLDVIDQCIFESRMTSLESCETHKEEEEDSH